MKRIIKHTEYDFNGYDSAMRELSREYPFLEQFSLGKSVLGKNIKALKLGNSKNVTLYAAAFHGSERITATIILRFVEELCFALTAGKNFTDIDTRRALKDKCIVFVPIVNPDGCDIALKGEAACFEHAAKLKRLCNGDFSHWNANARGIDINHNFDAGWETLHELERKHGFFGPGPTKYGGQKPHSEPETRALVDFCLNTHVDYCLAFHSQGEVIYWDYDNIPTHRGKKMAEIFAASSGYALDVPTGISVGGGFKDWFISTFRRPGFTIELGRGQNPLLAESGEEIYEKIKEMLMIGLIM